MLNTIADRIHRITLGLAIALFVAMFAVEVGIVLMRYVMGVGFLELQDGVNYAFAALVVLSIPLAMREGRHVRVDILRAGFSRQTNRRIDRLGHVAFTLPVFGLMAWNAWPLIRASWAIREGAMETGGLPGLYLVKATILLMCALVILRALVDLFAGERADDA